MGLDVSSILESPCCHFFIDAFNIAWLLEQYFLPGWMPFIVTQQTVLGIQSKADKIQITRVKTGPDSSMLHAKPSLPQFYLISNIALLLTTCIK